MQDFAKDVLKWVKSRGFEILATKPFEDGRVSFVAKITYKPGFVKEGKHEIKENRLAGVIETLESYKNTQATQQMNRLVMWKTMDRNDEKWLSLFVPSQLSREDIDHLYNYNQVVAYPIADNEVLDNEPKLSVLGVKGWKQ